MKDITYSSYVKKQGYTPLAGKDDEFEQLSKEIFEIRSRLRFLAFHDPENMYQQTLKERDQLMEKLKSISKPRRR